MEQEESYLNLEANLSKEKEFSDFLIGESTITNDIKKQTQSNSFLSGAFY